MPGKMRSDRVGVRGLALLTVAGLVGVGLAIHGYGHGEVVAGRGGVNALVSTSGSHGRPSAGQSPSPSSKATPPSTSHPPAQKVGPLLSSTSYAPYAFQVYPGPETSQARQATAGFTIRVAPRAGTIELSVAAMGSGQAPQTSSFPAGDRVYFIEATLGDESGDVDYNFGDDGVIVTDAHGHVVQ